jgi:putative transposase
MAVPTQANERRSLDLVHDQLADGRAVRVLNVVDSFSRKFVGQSVDTSIDAGRPKLFALMHPLPTSIVLDNGPELTRKAMFFRARIPASNAFSSNLANQRRMLSAKSFNGRIRDGCLNQHRFR